jgi:crotonobetainyl-CoA:carnitine CoA-transferase CaiB-like acyl-CoA transferase
MWIAIGALAGLLQRQRTGRGCIVDASLFETALAWMKGHIASFAVSGVVPERHRTGSHRVVPFEAFETKTGPIIIAAGNDRLFAKLADALGRPDWALDPRYAKGPARLAHKADLLAQIQEILATRSKGEWIDRLEAAGVPCAAIHTLPDALAQPQTEALGILQRLPDEDLTLVGLPLSFDGLRPAIRHGPPGPGEHTGDIRGRTR